MKRVALVAYGLVLLVVVFQTSLIKAWTCSGSILVLNSSDAWMRSIQGGQHIDEFDVVASLCLPAGGATNWGTNLNNGESANIYLDLDVEKATAGSWQTLVGCTIGTMTKGNVSGEVTITLDPETSCGNNGFEFSNVVDGADDDVEFDLDIDTDWTIVSSQHTVCEDRRLRLTILVEAINRMPPAIWTKEVVLFTCDHESRPPGQQDHHYEECVED